MQNLGQKNWSVKSEIGRKQLYYSDEDKYCVHPTEICKAALANDIQKVLDWLGPLPVDKERINARNPEFMDPTLVHSAGMGKDQT